jgi:hypothetical protein
VGFEPTRACALPVFKTGAINHSTTPPRFSFEKCAIDNSLGKPDTAADDRGYKKCLDSELCSVEHKQ